MPVLLVVARRQVDSNSPAMRVSQGIVAKRAGGYLDFQKLSLGGGKKVSRHDGTQIREAQRRVQAVSVLTARRSSAVERPNRKNRPRGCLRTGDLPRVHIPEPPVIWAFSNTALSSHSLEPVFGLLIQDASGTSGGCGTPRTKRSGCSLNASERVAFAHMSDGINFSVVNGRGCHESNAIRRGQIQADH